MLSLASITLAPKASNPPNLLYQSCGSSVNITIMMYCQMCESVVTVFCHSFLSFSISVRKRFFPFYQNLQLPPFEGRGHCSVWSAPASCVSDHNHIKHDRSCFALETEVDVEYVEKLVERETITFGYRCHASFDDCLITSHNWLKFARLDAIEWILNTRAIYGFRFHTAYLSVTYFDRFVSKRSIDEGKLWAIRLLSVACLSLAAKMEERKVPPLSEFPVEDFCFGNKVIQRMELLVLNTLEWRMNSITPFAYLHYFIHKTCGESTPKDTVSRAVELVVAMIKEIDLLDHRPSIIAAAAVLAASNRQLTRKELELKVDMISSWGSLENENVFSCYIAMQEIEMGKVKTPRLVFYPNSSAVHSGSFDVLENSSLVSGAGIKRSLTFNECDQTCPAKKICRT
ncbi:hypothetical protein NC652_018980 [Populus alba x Populus x berolinensis]|nr:hypothetical protein NC652_018980 [Populus alba x Populus x berolinensis]